MRFKRVCLIVLDSVGIGELPDALAYGDRGAHTLGHIAEQVQQFHIPHLAHLGLTQIEPLQGMKANQRPLAYYGKMAEMSVGKDTLTGHWELMGLHVSIPFKVFPQGFPRALIKEFEQKTGRAVIGNKVASGTEILQELAEEQKRTGSWIVYTSADSVFQIAAHEDIIPLQELYHACEIARQLTMDDEYAVGRVIARPYVGSQGVYQRTANRHDYVVQPPAKTVMNHLQDTHYDVIAIGKISDIYANEGVTRSIHTSSNRDGIEQVIQTMACPFTGLCFANLVDFDSLYGHRRDPQGYAQALMAFDQELPRILQGIQQNDLLIITADHGNDPTHRGTDHTREYVPLLVYSPSFQSSSSIGTRDTFADVAATIADNFQVRAPQIGTSFLQQLK